MQIKVFILRRGRSHRFSAVYANEISTLNCCYALSPHLAHKIHLPRHAVIINLSKTLNELIVEEIRLAYCGLSRIFIREGLSTKHGFCTFEGLWDPSGQN